MFDVEDDLDEREEAVLVLKEEDEVVLDLVEVPVVEDVWGCEASAKRVDRMSERKDTSIRRSSTADIGYG